MQTSNEINTIHIKVSLNNEFRRFSMDKSNFTKLEETIRSVYSLDPTEKFKICYIDDEKELVAMSSDEEFLYAIDLVRPVRLVVTLASASVQTPSQPCPVDEPQATHFEHSGPIHPCRRGRGRGGHWRGDKQGWHEERKKWREIENLSKEERIQRKIDRISERIKMVEALLLTDLPAHRERTLSWKLEKLQTKLENLQSSTTETQTFTSETSTPSTEAETCPARRGCRNGRGGRGGRGRFAENGDNCGKKWRQIDPQIWENIRSCRQSLRAAYQSGNQEEIDRCIKALDEAKLQKWEAKQKAKEGRPEKTQKFSEEKNRKRECIKNLREAKAAGDSEKIKECEVALLEAKEALQKAKMEKM